MLLLTGVDLILKKRGCKQNLIRPDGSSGGKVVFAPLTEIITIDEKLIIIDVKKLSFELISK